MQTLSCNILTFSWKGLGAVRRHCVGTMDMQVLSWKSGSGCTGQS